MIDPYCFPLPFLYECTSNYKYLDFILGIIPTIIIFFMGVQIIRYYFVDKNSGFKTSANYFILIMYYSVAIISTNIIPGDTYLSDKKPYIYSKFSAFLHLAAQVIIVEQTSMILKLLQIKGSTFTYWTVKTFKYAILAVAAVSSFSVLVPYDITSYLSSIIIYLEIVVRLLFIIMQSYAFVFLPQIDDLFRPKEIKTMRILIFLNSLSFIIYVSLTFIYLQEFNVLFGVGYKNMRNGMIMFAVNDFVMEYLPKFLMATTMFIISKVGGNDENIIDEFEPNDPLSQSLSEMGL